MADMAVYEEMTPDLLAPLLPALAAYRVWFLDTNLPEETLRFLLEDRPAGVAMVAVDAVSIATAARLHGRLDRIALLFANRAAIGLLAHMEIQLGRAPWRDRVCQYV